MVGLEFSEIRDVIETYFEGLYRADSVILGGVFHPDATYINATDGDYMQRSMAEYFAVVDTRTPPAQQGLTRQDVIHSIEIGGGSMAFVRARMTMMGRDYLDFLTLIQEGGQWRIMAKVFSYVPKKEGA